MDGQTDGQGESSIPLSNFLGRGYRNTCYALMSTVLHSWVVARDVVKEGHVHASFYIVHKNEHMVKINYVLLVFCCVFFMVEY